jgi:dihydroxyacid dehydratase/phosphogluconate dehydratase
VAAPDVLESTVPATHDVPKGLNKYSAVVTQPLSQGGSQAMLHATGLSDEDLNKPQVGLSLDVKLCTLHNSPGI